MTTAIPVRLYVPQRHAIDYLSDTNFALGPCKLIQMGVDLLIHVSRLNAGQIPLLSQVRIQRAMERKAKRDAKRNKHARR